MPSNKAQADSISYVDIPIYEPKAPNEGYVWLANDDAWVLAVFRITYNTTDAGPNNLDRPILPIRVGVGLGWNPTSSVSDNTRVFFTDFLSSNDNTTDTSFYDSFIVTVTIIGSNYPKRSYVYRRSDPGISPVAQLTNLLGNVDEWSDFCFLYAGNIGDFRIYLNDGSSRSNFTGSYFYNDIKVPRFLDNHIYIDGGNLNIGMDNEGQTAIEDAIDNLNNASEKLSSLAESLQVDKPNISTQPSAIINDSTYTALASLSPLLQADFVVALLVGSLTISLAFILLRGTKE